MNVQEREGGSFIILLDEIFDFKRVEEFRRAYEQIDAAKAKIISVDFAKTRYMDSSALGMLLNIKNHFKSHDATVKITSANDQIRKILTISRFDQRFVIE